MRNYDREKIRYHTEKIRHILSKYEFVLKGVDYYKKTDPSDYRRIEFSNMKTISKAP